MLSRVCTSVIVVALGGAAAGFEPRQADISDQAILQAAGRYVASYETQLTSILADESYSQQIVDQTPPETDTLRRRRLQSEVFFMFAPVRHDWLTIRDVVSVDGKTIQDRPNLRQQLQTLPAADVANAFRKLNSRYNIGRMFRNVSEPTLSLLVFDDRHQGRFTFERRRVETVNGATLVTVAFTERQAPTLIEDAEGAPMFVHGEAVIHAESGRVQRVELTAQKDNLRLGMTTVYRADAGLGIWVPSRFSEEYESGSRLRVFANSVPPAHERIICEAAYTNFRRFGTSVRIK